MDFVKSQFDKILLGFLVLFFAMLYLHAIHHGLTDTTFASFCGDSAKLFSGALLTLITGRLLQRKVDGNGQNAGDVQPNKS